MALVQRGVRSRATLGLLVAATLTLVTIDSRGAGVVDGPRRGALSALSSARGATDGVTSPVVDVWNGVFSYGEVEAENAELRARVAELEGQAVGSASAQAQLDELRELQGLTLVGDLQRVTAEITRGAPTNFDRSVEINRGSADGLERGMPVLTAAGLAGRVVEVTANSAIVSLITDPDMAVGVRLVASGDVGVARGTGPDRPLHIDAGISDSTTVELGEIVVTSGLVGGRYPADLPVGRVSSVREGDGSLTRELRVEPLAELDRLRFVEVVLWVADNS